MKLITQNGRMSLEFRGEMLLNNQPIGHMIKDDKLFAPLSSKTNGDTVHVEFECGHVDLKVTDCGDYLKLTIVDFAGGRYFTYGPYEIDLPEFAEELALAHDFKKAVCMQSLNPKTIGCFPESLPDLHPNGNDMAHDPSLFAGPDKSAFPTKNGTTIIQCYVEDMPEQITFNYENIKNAIASEIPEEDRSPIGSSVALFACDFDNLMPIIEKIELAEGLPHPTINGEWAKTSPLANQSYIQAKCKVENMPKAIDATLKTGLKCIYNQRPFKSWGHFEIDENKIGEPGDDGMKNYVARMKDLGLACGFHTLTNFIHQHDPYVTPIPDKRLLIAYKTTLVEDIDSENTDRLVVADKDNFNEDLPLNVVRIGDELIEFKKFTENGGEFVLSELNRGAFGTYASAHKAGDEVGRLWSHGYKVLFPDFDMMCEISERIGSLVNYSKITRMSFDGIEGCFYLGRGEYALSEFVRRCFEKTGSEFLTDASGSSHYRWHAHTYYNWGEAWDSERRGGMYNCRVNNQNYFRRNFVRPMLGQFEIDLATGRHEATSPEAFESMMSRSIAFDAGFGLYIYDTTFDHGLHEQFFENVRIWNDMRYNGDIPAEIREKMKVEYSDWHLEETDGGWDIYELNVEKHELPYYTTTANGLEGELLVTDCCFINTPLKCRIRVGTPIQEGEIRNPAFHHCWSGNTNEYIKFNITAKAGEYLIYNGGTTLELRDKDYKLIKVVEGEGVPVIISGTKRIDQVAFTYDTEDIDKMTVVAKVFTIRSITHVKRK
ncbi:MAG: hypothetical protein E7672_04950 [Ruminococcaceae bacterium]|nr:hypothetical protein [Oscillospiraceae bacterium]